MSAQNSAQGSTAQGTSVLESAVQESSVRESGARTQQAAPATVVDAPEEHAWEGLSMVARAEAVARQAHAGQVDKAGRPYIGHPARVAGHARTRCEERGVYGYEADLVLAAAWMHDVLEDTPVSESWLAERFPAPVVQAVEAVTKRAGEPVEEYFARVRAVPAAVLVKRADLDDNTDPRRTALLDEETRDRLAAKYARARRLLEGACADEETGAETEGERTGSALQEGPIS